MVQANDTPTLKNLFLCCLVPLLALAACGGEEATNQPSPTVIALPPATRDVIPTLQVAVVSDDFAVGTQRVPFVLYDGPNRVKDAQKVKVTLFDLTQNPPQPGAFFWATGYNDYAIPYWVVYLAIATAGNWGLLAQVVEPDGQVVEAQFVIEVLDKPKAPALGDAALPSANRTVATEPALEKLTSDVEPNPALVAEDRDRSAGASGVECANTAGRAFGFSGGGSGPRCATDQRTNRDSVDLWGSK